MPVPVRYPARWDAKTRQTKEQNPKACLSSNPLNVRTVAVPSDPAQTPVRPASILSFDPYHLCSFWALSSSPVLSKQFKNLKSLGTVTSSEYTVPWNQRQERNPGGAFLLPHFPLGTAGPKGRYLFWYFSDFSSLPLEFFRSHFWDLISKIFHSKVVHAAAQGMVRFSLSRAIKWRCRWWYFSTRPWLEGTVSRFLRTCNSMLHIKGVRATLLPSVPHAAPSYEPHLSLQLYTYRTRVIPKMPRCSTVSLQQGFQKFLPGLLSLFLNTGRASVLSRKRKIWAFYLGKLLSQASGDFPFLLIVKFIAQQQNRNPVSHSFLQNRSSLH